MRNLIFILWVALVGCQVQKGENSPQAQQQPYVILVSLDGYRADYTALHEAPTLARMSETGAFGPMYPSFPSKTFPNHYTLVTGLYPGSHGLMGNTFYSRSRDTTYMMRNRKQVEDGSWYGGVPLWVLAEQQGMVSASYFWVGSEANILDTYPTYYYRYDERVPMQDRVKQVIDWLEYPEATRPHFITLYFSVVDSKGHRHGPVAPETRQAVQDVDAQLAVLRQYLAASSLPAYLIVVSDHGMTEVNQAVDISKVDFGSAITINSGTQLDVFSSNKTLIDAIQEQLRAFEKLTLFQKNQIPEHFHYQNKDRTPDLMAIVPPPNIIVTDSGQQIRGGAHGFDPYAHPEMQAVFYAEGPDIKAGVTLQTFDNVHVYPFIAHLLGLKSPPVDGEDKLIRALLED